MSIHRPQTPQDQSTFNQIDDLVSVPPNWLLNSGIFIIALLTMVLLTLSAFIKYPDKIVTKGIMTSDNPPIEHFSNAGGTIKEILVTNGELVKEDVALIYLNNNASRADVNRLSTFIKTYKSTKYNYKYRSINFPKHLRLGELQENYSRFELLFVRLQQTLNQLGVERQIQTLNNEIENTKYLIDILGKEKEISNEEMKLVETNYNRQLDLNDYGAVSDIDKERAKGELFRYRKQSIGLDKGIIQNKIREDQLHFESQKLIEGREIEIQSQLNDLAQVANILESNLADWDRKYIIRALTPGEVSLIPTLTKDQFVPSRTQLLSIIPVNTYSNKYVRSMTSNERIGKINQGDQVILKIDGYPYKEFGSITSGVENISVLPELFKHPNGAMEYMYSITIGLPDTMTTNIGQQIEFSPNSMVTAEIITSEKSILERIFEKFVSIIK